jgi:hypothetical protein
MEISMRNYFLSRERRIRLLIDLTEMRMPRDLAFECASVPDHIQQVDSYLDSMTRKLHRHVGQLIIETDHTKHNSLRAFIGTEILIVSMYAMEIADRYNRSEKPLAVTHNHPVH